MCVRHNQQGTKIMTTTENKVTKTVLIRKIRDVMAGYDGSTYMEVIPVSRGYKIIAEGIGRIPSECYNSDTMLFKHCCNDCTIKEATESLEYHYGLLDVV